MTEADRLREEGQLFTDAQYKKCRLMIFISWAVSSAVTIGGLVIAIIAGGESGIMAGMIICIAGALMMMAAAIITFRHWVKISLYKHYKKLPEDFEVEVPRFRKGRIVKK